ncbi:hypothetical protein K437DRAFT_255017 [Tilletiaria anomala UBC 951]|uniref:Membrane-associated proteins in eicosanoid and glutathione metabolism n=1 Tax=Tilletiaria anomala (strain ATCC 24038 / CBS 436.72 / UBC 951) TaxID=1037660 RepID=A0A066WAW9_TILAU|nr:uncharacterized protein K437DRAFT_255017 [Tilletiaria anomala UBC 951]KDN50846.1 hypothetical protein K437DRAFT_255017 [Tilletiaria anomala UBC 951]
MPLFVLSPASLAHSALFAGYYSYLTANVMSLRVKTGIFLGQGDADSIRQKGRTDTPSPREVEKLKRAVRAQGNFAEGTPFAFFLLFLAELNGAPTSLVHGGYLTLFTARILHGFFGIQDESTAALGRPIGTIVTLLVTSGAGLYNLNLGWEPLKSFLGFK